MSISGPKKPAQAFSRDDISSFYSTVAKLASDATEPLSPTCKVLRTQFLSYAKDPKQAGLNRIVSSQIKMLRNRKKELFSDASGLIEADIAEGGVHLKTIVDEVGVVDFVLSLNQVAEESFVPDADSKAQVPDFKALRTGKDILNVTVFHSLPPVVPEINYDENLQKSKKALQDAKDPEQIKLLERDLIASTRDFLIFHSDKNFSLRHQREVIDQCLPAAEIFERVIQKSEGQDKYFYSREFSFFLIRLGSIYFYLEDLLPAFDAYKKGIHILSSIPSLSKEDRLDGIAFLKDFVFISAKLGDFYFASEEYEMAIKYYQEGADLFEKYVAGVALNQTDKKDKKDYLQLKCKLAYALASQADFILSVEQDFHLAVKIFIDSMKTWENVSDPIILETYNEKRKSKEADFFTEVEKYMASSFGQQVARLNLIELIERLKYIIDSYRHTKNTRLVELSTLLVTIGRMYLKINLFDLAYEAFMEAGGYDSQNFQYEHTADRSFSYRKAACAVIFIGKMYQDKGKYEEAVTKYHAALKQYYSFIEDFDEDDRAHFIVVRRQLLNLYKILAKKVLAEKKPIHRAIEWCQIGLVVCKEIPTIEGYDSQKEQLEMLLKHVQQKTTLPLMEAVSNKENIGLEFKNDFPNKPSSPKKVFQAPQKGSPSHQGLLKQPSPKKSLLGESSAVNVVPPQPKNSVQKSVRRRLSF